MITKPTISIILPSIRSENLVSFYNSLCLSCKKYTFELIIVGPYPLPTDLENYKNIKYVRDFGSPNRAQCIAVLLCEGEIVTWQGDDALMEENSIDTHIDMLKNMGSDIRNVVVAKYREGQFGSINRETHHPDQYFMIAYGPAGSPYLQTNWWLFNVAFVYRELLEHLGGFDSRFQGTWSAQTDLAIRAQFFGVNVKMSGIDCMVCDHEPAGNHKPIEECQNFNDVPLLNSIYRDPNWTKSRNVTVDGFSWKTEESVWSKRFK